MGGQVAFPGASLYHASKWGIEKRTRESWDQQQLASGDATLHVRMRPRGFGERIDASDPDLQVAARDPVEQLSCVCAEQRRRMHMVGEASVADLDALRQAHDVERPGTTGIAVRDHIIVGTSGLAGL